MLAPYFREGTELSINGNVEIQCPKDDGRTIELLYKIMHHRPYQVERPGTPKDLVKIADLSDKYELNPVMKVYAEAWFSSLYELANLDVTGERELWRGELLVVAYVFGLPSLFAKTGRCLVTKSRRAIIARDFRAISRSDGDLADVFGKWRFPACGCYC